MDTSDCSMNTLRYQTNEIIGASDNPTTQTETGPKKDNQMEEYVKYDSDDEEKPDISKSQSVKTIIKNQKPRSKIGNIRKFTWSRKWIGSQK